MTTATVAADTTAARYSEAVHFLTDKPMRATILGLAEIEAKHRGGRPKEGDMIRKLIEDALVAVANSDPETYAKAIKLGTTALRRRDQAKAKRRADRLSAAPRA